VKQVTLAGYRSKLAHWITSLSRIVRFSTVAVSFNAAAGSAKREGTARAEERILGFGFVTLTVVGLMSGSTCVWS
jgi:hypothetical protein